MRKILVISECSFHNPTFRIVLDSLALEYAGRGHSVRVAAPLSPYTLSEPRGAKNRRTSWGTLMRLWGNDGGRVPSVNIAKLAPLTREADFVHLHLIGDYTEAVLRLDRLLRASKAAVLASFHDYRNPSIRRTPESVAGYASLLHGREATVPSRFGRNLLLEDFPFLKGRIAIVPDGVQLEPLTRRAPETPFVLCPAWLAYYKAPDILMMAWAALENPPPLVFAGHDPGGQARALAERLGLTRSGQVRFLGQIGHRRTLGLMAASEFVVLPSRHEFFGMAALEAMALGKAVVASATGPTDFIRNEVSGLLVPPGKIAPLARALKRLLEDAPLRRRLGREAKRTAARYTWESAAARYLDLL